jgi:predicted ArsR family transcriptional regulator
MAYAIRQDAARVLAYMAGDLTVAEWAVRLDMSPHAVRLHCRVLSVRTADGPHSRMPCRAWPGEQAAQIARIVSALAGHAGSTATQIARAARVPAWVARLRLAEMAQDGLVRAERGERKGGGRPPRRWFVIEEAHDVAAK